MNNNGIFSLDNFVGSLDFLIHLVDRDEVQITDVPVRSLTGQFLQKLPVPVDTAAEWIYWVSYLAWLKSKALLPVHEQVVQTEDESDPHFEIIHHLVDYCRFKEVAKQLSERHEQQRSYFMRGLPEPEEKQRGLLQPLSLDQLQAVIQDILKKVPLGTPTIKEDPWRVSDKIAQIRFHLKQSDAIPFVDLFNINKGRLELIVTFLALLELMKRGELLVAEGEDKNLIIMGRHE